MLKLLLTENPETFHTKLKKDNPSWILLNKNKVIALAKDRESYSDRTFILPYDLVNRRYAATKLSMLIGYVVAYSRPRNQSFIIVAPSKDRVDLRLQRMIDKEVE